MEVYNNSKGAMLLVMVMMMMMMILLNAYCCGAHAVVAKSNTSFGCRSGRVDECLLIEEDLDLELGFLINPYVSRILAGPQGSKHPTPGNPDKTAFPCGKPEDKNPGYSACIANLNKNNHKCVPKDSFTRCPP